MFLSELDHVPPADKIPRKIVGDIPETLPPSMSVMCRKIVCEKLGTNFREVTRIVSNKLSLTPESGKVIVRNEYLGINASDINFTNGTYLPGVQPPFDTGFEAVGKVPSRSAATDADPTSNPPAEKDEARHPSADHASCGVMPITPFPAILHMRTTKNRRTNPLRSNHPVKRGSFPRSRFAGMFTPLPLYYTLFAQRGVWVCRLDGDPALLAWMAPWPSVPCR